jgi:chromosome segregation ATPase
VPPEPKQSKMKRKRPIALGAILTALAVAPSLFLTQSLHEQREQAAALHQRLAQVEERSDKANERIRAAEANAAEARAEAKKLKKRADAAESAAKAALEQAASQVVKVEAARIEAEARAAEIQAAAGEAVDATFDYLAVTQCIQALQQIHYDSWDEFMAARDACYQGD